MPHMKSDGIQLYTLRDLTAKDFAGTMKQVAAKLKGAESADAQFEAARDMMLAGLAMLVAHAMFKAALFMVVAVTMTLVLFAGGPTGAISFAQQQTTSPPGPTIEWLNPDEDTSNEISAKDDTPGDQTTNSYHLVATVSQVPANAVVSFLYRSGSGTPTMIGSATLVGADTYELEWAQANMPADVNAEKDAEKASA